MVTTTMKCAVEACRGVLSLTRGIVVATTIYPAYDSRRHPIYRQIVVETLYPSTVGLLQRQSHSASPKAISLDVSYGLISSNKFQTVPFTGQKCKHILCYGLWVCVFDIYTYIYVCVHMCGKYYYY